MMQNKSKLRTLSFLKQTWKLEDYLITVKNIADRTALTKFRLSDHSLMIEKGRHSNIHQSDRCCPFCPNQIEDESHFLIKCPIYSNLRKKLLNDLETLCIGFFYPQDEEFLFWFLLNNPIISGSTAKFIRLGMELRAFLLEEPRKRDWTILLLIFFLAIVVLFTFCVLLQIIILLYCHFYYFVIVFFITSCIFRVVLLLECTYTRKY